MMELPFRYILTVSELTQEIKDILELKFPDIWVEGEISNLRIPPSGHIYFTLKDNFSPIRTVLFKMQARTLSFVLEDGLHVVYRERLRDWGHWKRLGSDQDNRLTGELDWKVLQGEGKECCCDKRRIIRHSERRYFFNSPSAC